jgi:hypothetical protein
MKRALLFLLVVGLCGAVSAHIGGLTYDLYEISTDELPDLRDGSTDDWEAVLTGTSLDHNDYAPLAVKEGAPIDPTDLAFKSWMAWHYTSQTIWMAVERIDDAYVNTYPGGALQDLWKHDGLEFMVDGDHSGGDFNGNDAFPQGADSPQWEKDLYANYQGQQYICIPESPDGRVLGYQGKGQDWVCQPPFGDAGGFSEDAGDGYTRSVMEIMVTPWDECVWQGSNLSKRSSLEPDGIIGFQISIMDWDVPGTYHAFHTLSGMSATWRKADNFVDGLLVGCDYEDCSGGDPGEVDIAVKADSWGRIKASVQ